MEFIPQGKRQEYLHSNFPSHLVFDQSFQDRIHAYLLQSIQDAAAQDFADTPRKLADLQITLTLDPFFSLSVLAQASFDFVDYTFNRTQKTSISYRKKIIPDSMEQLRSWLWGQTEKAARQLWQSLLPNAVRSRGSTLKDVLDRWNFLHLSFPVADRFQEQTGRSVEAVLQEATAQVEATEGQALLRDLNTRLNQQSRPFFCPGVAEQITLKTELTRDYCVSLECCLTVRYRHVSQDTASRQSGNLFPLLRKMDPSALEELIASLARDCLEYFRKQAKTELPLFEFCIPPELETDPSCESLATLLREGVLSKENLTLHLQNCSALFSWDGIHVLPVQLPLMEPRWISRREGLPSDAFCTLVRNLEQIGSRFCTLQAAEPYPPVTLSFRFSTSEILSHLDSPDWDFSCSEQVLTRKDTDAILRLDPDWIRQFLNRILEDRRNRYREPEIQLEILHSLNEVQLKMLQFVYRFKKHNHWESGISRQNLMDQFGHSSLSRAAIQSYPDRLTSICLPVNGLSKPLLVTASDSNRYGYYTTYERNPGIPKSLILSIRPRPFGPEDLPDMTREARETWIQKRMQTAVSQGKEEDLWSVLVLLQEHLSKAAAARLLNTEAGKALLQKLTGSEREYALLYLETLPGCRQLAAQLQQPAEGDDPSSPSG